MSTERLYIIEVKQGDEWIPTMWTNLRDRTEFPASARPVPLEEAEGCLAEAERFYRHSYRITEVAK